MKRGNNLPPESTQDPYYGPEESERSPLGGSTIPDRYHEKDERPHFVTDQSVETGGHQEVAGAQAPEIEETDLPFMG